jgi:hypothetical protein
MDLGSSASRIRPAFSSAAPSQNGTRGRGSLVGFLPASGRDPNGSRPRRSPGGRAGNSKGASPFKRRGCRCQSGCPCLLPLPTIHVNRGAHRGICELLFCLTAVGMRGGKRCAASACCGGRGCTACGKRNIGFSRLVGYCSECTFEEKHLVCIPGLARHGRSHWVPGRTDPFGARCLCAERRQDGQDDCWQLLGVQSLMPLSSVSRPAFWERGPGMSEHRRVVINVPCWNGHSCTSNNCVGAFCNPAFFSILIAGRMKSSAGLAAKQAASSKASHPIDDLHKCFGETWPRLPTRKLDLRGSWQSRSREPCQQRSPGRRPNPTWPTQRAGRPQILGRTILHPPRYRGG